MIEYAEHDRIDITRKHARGVGDRLAASELHFGAGEHDRFAAEFAHRDIEGNAGSRRRAIENHRQGLAFQRTRRGAAVLRAPDLHGGRRVEDAPQRRRRHVEQVEEMAGGGAAVGRGHAAATFGSEAEPASASAQAAWSRRTPSLNSSSEMTSGG